MEHMISCFGSEVNKSALVASESGLWNADRAVQHYHLALGVPMHAVLNKKNEGTAVVPGEARGVRITSPFLQALCDRQICRIIRELGRTRTGVLEAALHELVLPATDDKVTQSGSPLRPSLKATQLLSIIGTQLAKQKFTLQFDITGFRLDCASFLDTLALKPGQIQIFRHPNPRDNHSTLVQYLLRSNSRMPALKTAAAMLRTHI